MNRRCTCMSNDRFVHDSHCDLWHDPAFDAGFAEWDPTMERLVYEKEGLKILHEMGMDVETDNQAAVDEIIEALDAQYVDDSEWNYITVEDYALLLDGEGLEGASEHLDDLAAEALEHPVPVFTACGTTWVWSDELETFLANPLGCYCGAMESTAENWCQRCGVFRSATKKDEYRQITKMVWEVMCRCFPPKKFACVECKVRRDDENGPWEPWDVPTDKQGQLALGGVKGAGTWGSTWSGDWGGTWGGNYTYTPKCRHHQKEVMFPNGTKVLASSHSYSGEKGDSVPVFMGFYLDSVWKPSHLALHINWPDYGLPKVPMDQLDYAVRFAQKLADAGENVEVGCIGGHGRTGTFLACLAVLCGVDAEKAVSWVRSNYCKEAIESDEQEWLPLAFDAHLKGVEPPPKPEYVPKQTTFHGMKDSDFQVNAGKNVSLMLDTKGKMWYCKACNTDLVQGRWFALRCWWCDGKFDAEYQQRVDLLKKHEIKFEDLKGVPMARSEAAVKKVRQIKPGTARKMDEPKVLVDLGDRILCRWCQRPAILKKNSIDTYQWFHKHNHKHPVFSCSKRGDR